MVVTTKLREWRQRELAGKKGRPKGSRNLKKTKSAAKGAAAARPKGGGHHKKTKSAAKGKAATTPTGARPVRKSAMKSAGGARPLSRRVGERFESFPYIRVSERLRLSHRAMREIIRRFISQRGHLLYPVIPGLSPKFAKRALHHSLSMRGAVYARYKEAIAATDGQAIKMDASFLKLSAVSRREAKRAATMSPASSLGGSDTTSSSENEGTEASSSEEEDTSDGASACDEEEEEEEEEEEREESDSEKSESESGREETAPASRA